MYALSKSQIQRIVLGYIKDDILFEKIKDEIHSYVDDEFIKSVLNGVDPDTLDGLNEIAEWVKEHQDLYKTLKDIVDSNVERIDKIIEEHIKEQYGDLVKRIELIENANVEDLKNQISELKSELDELKSKSLVTAKTEEKTTSKIDAQFGGIGIKFVD